MSAKYEDLKAKLETRETPETHLLLVHIPEGFQRQHVAAKIEFDYGRVRVYGELPPENNVIKRFSEVYKVPETCDINNIRGKFEGRIVTITMQKKEISEVPPDQMPQQPAAPEAPKTEQETEQEPEKDQEGTPPQPQPGEDQQGPSDDEKKDQKVQEDQYQQQEEQQEATADKEEDQKGQEGLSEQDSKPTTENKEKADIETPPPTKPEATTEESMPETDQKVVPQEDTSIEDAQRGEIEKKKSFEQGKQPETAAVLGESPATDQKESNNKRKASSALVPSVPSDQEKIIQEPTPKRMMTIFEDKQKLIYMGAAIAVVALGVYVSYKLRSSARK